MDNNGTSPEKISKKSFFASLIGDNRILLLCAAGIIINYLLSGLVSLLGLPLYLDNVGTLLTAIMGGWLPGVAVGLINNILNSIAYSPSIYYGVISTLIASVTTFISNKGRLKKPQWVILLTVILALIGGGLGTFLPWFLDAVPFESEFFNNAAIKNAAGLTESESQLLANLLMDLIDKALTVAITLIILRLLPESFQKSFRFNGRMQAHVSEDELDAAKHIKCRSVSVRTRIILVLSLTMVVVGAACSGISLMIFHTETINEHRQYAEGAANLTARVIDGDRVEDYITNGESAEGYSETEDMLYGIRESSPDIEYIYVYQILEDGCHVVFDLDTDDLAGSEPGEIIPFDESFVPYLDSLLAGEPIEPIITDDTYGWLLTVYKPVYDSSGKCVCYACADVSMNQLRLNERSFFTEMISLFFGIFVLILAFVWKMVEYNIIMPVNTMALRTDKFAFGGDLNESSVNKIKSLNIHTGDEIENLYLSILKMSEDSVTYVNDIATKNETISKMQTALIMVLADMVENRDKNTGDHVRKTAAYSGILLREMKKQGYYADQLTDEFIQNVIDSAPLHDVGKIIIPDAILNKPGKLTDEEFDIMKTHTTAGSEIISKVIAIVPESGYLLETKNLAHYHHEKWNGKGYPTGLAGEDIPLSARVMAVADVFDALTSRRSYKEPFSFEKASDIITEGRGSHFDPLIVDAFISAADEMRDVCEKFNKAGVPAGDPAGDPQSMTRI